MEDIQKRITEEAVNKLWTDDEQKKLVIISQGLTKIKNEDMDKLNTYIKETYLEARPNETYKTYFKGTNYTKYYSYYQTEHYMKNYIMEKFDITFTIPNDNKILSLQNILSLMRTGKKDGNYQQYSISGNNLIKEYDDVPLTSYVFGKNSGYISMTSKTKTHKFYSIYRGTVTNITAKHWLDGIKKYKETMPTAEDVEKCSQILQLLDELNLRDRRYYWHDDLISQLEGKEYLYKYNYLPQNIIELAKKQAVVEELQHISKWRR